MSSITVGQALDYAIQRFTAARYAEAEAICQNILIVQPEHPGTVHLLGLIASQNGQHEAALALLRRAICADPNVADFHNSLGSTLVSCGQLPEAIAAFRRAVELQPQHTVARGNLGNALSENGQHAEAVAAHRQALALAPGYAMGHYNLANALGHQGDLDGAIAAYRHALTLDPLDPHCWNNLGNALKAQGELGAAVAACQRAVQLLPKLGSAHNNLGAALQDQGRIAEALSSYREAVRLWPASAAFHSNLLIALHYSPQTTLAELFRAHGEYDRFHAAPLQAAARPHENLPDPDRPLRLGFVSPHFANHPVGRFLIRPLEHLDQEQFPAICYSDTAENDDTSARLRAAVSGWVEVRSFTDDALTERIRADRIDILFDLAGPTAGHRLGVFARKPAPIQITWLDYVGTTGLTAMDYILADPHEIPPDAEPWYREKVLRMAHDYICYDPPAAAPAVSALPALANGFVTFGSFNILDKTTPEIVAIWARILHRVPGSRLVLMNRGLDDPPTAARYRQMFLDHGIAAARLTLRGRCAPEEALARYHEIDLALDTWPYNGGLTTCEALWMGVPVITCPGETFCSRHGLTHLTAASFPETIATSLDHYVDLAVSLTSDLPRLATLRSAMRPQIRTSPLCDGAAFAAHLQVLLRSVWHDWARKKQTR